MSTTPAPAVETSKTVKFTLSLDDEPRKTRKPRASRGSGCIYLRGRVYWIQYVIGKHRYHESAYTTKKTVARELLTRKIANAQDGILRPTRLSHETLRDDLYADYKTRNHKSLLTRKDGTQYIGTVPALDEFFAGHKVGDITTDAMKTFIQKRQKEGISNSGINGSLAALRRMFWLRVKEHKFPRSLVPHFPMLPKDQPRTDYLTAAEYEKLLKELRSELRPLLTVAFFTGARRGELLKLRWADVDLAAGEHGFLVFRDTKNREDRFVPLVAEARTALDALRAAHPDSDFVFVRDDGRHVKNFRKAWELALKRAGLGQKLFHGLRRGVTTSLAEAGVPEQTAMAFTGHRDIATHRRYRQLMQSNLVNAAKALESHIAKS